MGRLTDEELADVIESHGPQWDWPACDSATVRALADEVKERRAQDLDKDELMLLRWIRDVADTWEGIDAPKARALLDKLLARGGR